MTVLDGLGALAFFGAIAVVETAATLSVFHLLRKRLIAQRKREILEG